MEDIILQIKNKEKEIQELIKSALNKKEIEIKNLQIQSSQKISEKEKK
ncbi:MAG: hypothetical protein ACK4JE_01835 [Endomicrobiia bacterium]